MKSTFIMKHTTLIAAFNKTMKLQKELEITLDALATSLVSEVFLRNLPEHCIEITRSDDAYKVNVANAPDMDPTVYAQCKKLVTDTWVMIRCKIPLEFTEEPLAYGDDVVDYTTLIIGPKYNDKEEADGIISPIIEIKKHFSMKGG